MVLLETEIDDQQLDSALDAEIDDGFLNEGRSMSPDLMSRFSRGCLILSIHLHANDPWAGNHKTSPREIITEELILWKRENPKRHIYAHLTPYIH